MRWLAALLALACAQAAAQGTNPCGTVPQAVAWAEAPAFKPLACLPDTAASTPYARALRVTPGKGYLAWWSCLAPDGTTAKHAVAIPGETAIPSMVAAALLLPDPAEALASLNRLYVMFNDISWFDPRLTAVWCPHEREVGAFLAVPAPPPPVPGWAVAKNGTSATRGFYPVVNGVRAATPIGQVAVGAACDCSAPILESSPWVGSLSYCPAAGMPSQTVTLCTKP